MCCLKNQMDRLLVHEGRRISMMLYALHDSHERFFTEPMAEEKGTPTGKYDLKATKVVTEYGCVVKLHVRNIRIAWERGPLRASEVY